MWQRWERGKQTLVHVTSIISQRFSVWVCASEPSTWDWWWGMWEQDWVCKHFKYIMLSVHTLCMIVKKDDEPHNHGKFWHVLRKKSHKLYESCMCELKGRHPVWISQMTVCILLFLLHIVFTLRSFLHSSNTREEVFIVTDPMSHPSLNQTLARVLVNMNSTHVPFAFFTHIQKASNALIALFSRLIIVCCLPGRPRRDSLPILLNNCRHWTKTGYVDLTATVEWAQRDGRLEDERFALSLFGRNGV